LVRPLDAGDVSQKSTNGVARGIVEVIELSEREALNCRERGRPRVGQHPDESSDGRRVASDWLDPQRPGLHQV
jgi:hypothetical protein